jgi:adenylylsulfate kinase
MSWAIWITGLPGSGKTVLARAAAATLGARGESVTVLDLDDLRPVLTPAPRYTAEERDGVYRALVFVARLLTEAGAPVLIAATGHRRAWRGLARSRLARFAEVELRCPLAVCREREARRTEGPAPRDIYARAGQPGATVPGVDVPWEPSEAPELTIDTDREAPPAAARRIVALAAGLAAPGGARPRPAPGWAVWVTGPRGSGKTTLVRGVAQALAREGEPARVLGVEEVREALEPLALDAAAAEDLVHRALVAGAWRLTDAGVSVLVDATAPRRSWRELARRLIPCFAEVELCCPAEVCLERERAARWGLAPGARSGGPALALAYEAPACPELRLYTEQLSVWSAVEEVVRLVRRLERRPPLEVTSARREPSCGSES